MFLCNIAMIKSGTYRTLLTHQGFLRGILSSTLFSLDVRPGAQIDI